MRRLTTCEARIGPEAKGADDEPIGRISRAARAGRPVPVANPQELSLRHAGRWHHLRRRDPDRADQEGPGARAGRQRGDVARHPEGQPGHARHPLGLRLLHRRSGRDRPRGRGRDLAGRRRLRHQLRRAAAAHQPGVERRQGSDQAAGRSALSRHSHRRRSERTLPVRQAEADPADGGRGVVRGQPGLRNRARPAGHRGGRAAWRAPIRGGSAIARSRAVSTSAARSAPATISSKSRSSTASSTRPRPKSWVFTKGRSPS